MMTTTIMMMRERDEKDDVDDADDDNDEGDDDDHDANYTGNEFHRVQS